MLNRIYIVSALALFSCSTQTDNQNNPMADSSKNFITSEQLLAKQDVIAPELAYEIQERDTASDGNNVERAAH